MDSNGDMFFGGFIGCVLLLVLFLTHSLSCAVGYGELNKEFIDNLKKNRVPKVVLQQTSDSSNTFREKIEWRDK